MSEQNEESKKNKLDKIDTETENYLKNLFFNQQDRKICFFIGRYYSYLANKEKANLKTTSLYTKLPIYTKHLEKSQLLKILDKCSDVVKRLISKHKSISNTGSFILKKINDLIAQDNWESSTEELSLAFMMGFNFFVRTNPEDQENSKNNEE